MSSENVWPESLMIRDTQLHDDMGGGGQRIYTTAGRGYEKRKYIRADLVEETERSGDVRDLSKQLAALAYHIHQTGRADKQDADTVLEAARILLTTTQQPRRLIAIEHPFSDDPAMFLPPTSGNEGGEAVKRYLINYDSRGEQEHPSGDFVHYSDYAALAETVERLTRERDALRRLVERAQNVVPEYLVNWHAAARATLAQERDDG